MRTQSKDQSSLFGYFVPGTSEVSSHAPLCACGECASPVVTFTGEPAAATEGKLLGMFYSDSQVEKFTNSFDGVEAVLTPLVDGRFSVRLRDIDADRFLPIVYQFSDVEAARDKGRKLAGVERG